ncbi:hypothetical protein [Undibacterium luofuense]|uniref:hypothetical protein n=1 Tax=Undibacterium luofuense TaxID=2828733 RepID=UPI0030EB55F6
MSWTFVFVLAGTAYGFKVLGLVLLGGRRLPTVVERCSALIPAWRSADSVDGKLYGMPYDGEVTIQVYRKDLYEAKGLKVGLFTDAAAALAQNSAAPASA